MVFAWRWPRSRLLAEYRGCRRGAGDHGGPPAGQGRRYGPRVHRSRSTLATSVAHDQSCAQAIRAAQIGSTHPNESRDMPQEDHYEQSPWQSCEKNAVGIPRRAFLAAGAAATVLAGSHTSFAQNHPPDATALASEAAMPNTVKIDRLDGSILLIGIDRQGSQNRIDPSTFLGLGRAYYLLDHDPTLRVGVLYAQGPDFVTGLDATAWEPSLRAGRFLPGTREFIDPVGTVPPRREKPLVVAVQGKTQT